ncbi:OB-fold domain-containing protein [Streptomyces sp. NPDC001984]
MKILSCATYLPAYRVSRAEIAAFTGGTDTGERVAAGGDEDSTTMAVAAARHVLTAGRPVGTLALATSSPVYADKSNATTVVAALDLDPGTLAVDLGPSVRAGAAGLALTARTGGLAVLSDLRESYTGSVGERRSADGATAVLFGDDGGPAVADVIATTSRSVEVVDRWRAPGSPFGRSWEERFGESVALRLVDELAGWAESAAGSRASWRITVTSPNPRAASTVGKALRRRLGVSADGADLTDVGDVGAAALGVALTRTLDQADIGDHVLVASFADGYDALLLRKTGDVAADASAVPPVTVPYARYLSWRDRFVREAQRRPDPMRVSAPFANRDADFKFAFGGGRCPACGQVQFPSPLVCLACGGSGPFEPVRGADSKGTVVTWTVDRLALTLDPPVTSAVIELDVGGRVQLEMTAGTTGLRPGARVELVFRRLGVVDGIVNYFWKARPIGAE